MILGNSEKFKGTGYVCYIDVLGFSDDIMNNWANQKSNPLEKILSIKRDMPIFSELEVDDIEGRRYLCRVNSVSDSVTICFGFKDEIIVGDILLGLEAILGNISYIWSRFIMSGYTIRGSIDYGDIYWDENDLIGPAFINAYLLESKIAKNSRILVSPNLNSVFSTLMEKYDIYATRHLLKQFRKDVDGYIIVDPNILYQSESERSNLIEALKKMRDSSPSGIIREKYNPLINMLSEETKIDLKSSDLGSY